MSKARFLAVLIVGVLVAACGGQSTGPVEGDQATDTAAPAATEKVFEEDFESGKADEWKAGEGAATTTTSATDQ